MKFLTKKSFLITSFILVILTLVFVESVNSDWCKISSVCSYLYWNNVWNEIVPTFLIALAVAIFPLSLIILPLAHTVFEKWRYFAIWAVPIMVGLTMIIWQLPSGGGLPGQFHPGIIFLPLLYGVYFLTSIIIARAWWQSRR